MKGRLFLAKRNRVKSDIERGCRNGIIIFYRYHSLFYFLFLRFSLLLSCQE